MNSSCEWYDVGNEDVTSLLCLFSVKGCLRLQELELDRTIAINEEIAHAMCLCGLRGLETISFTFTPVSPGAIKELFGNNNWIFIWIFFSPDAWFCLPKNCAILLIKIVLRPLGACPRLERIEVHIGISDYFIDVDDDVTKRKYSCIVKKLEVIR